MRLRLDDWLKDGDKVYVLDTRVLTRRLGVDGRSIAPKLREAVLVSEAVKVGSRVVMSERMLKEYLPDEFEEIARVAPDMARVARNAPHSSFAQIDSYEKSVFVSLEGVVSGEPDESSAELERLREKARGFDEVQRRYEAQIAELERSLRERSAREIESARESYESRVRSLEEALAQKGSVDERELSELRAKAASVTNYEERISALTRENQRVRSLLDEEKRRFSQEVSKASEKAPVQGAHLSQAGDVEQLRSKIERLERDLRVERRAARHADNAILVPADEFNALCDQAESVDELLEEVEMLRSAVKEKRKKVYVEDELELDKRGAAAKMADNSGKVIAVYGGEAVELHNDLHLYRAYEVLHAMKLHGERCEQGVRMPVENVTRLVSDADNKESRMRAYERWKEKISKFGVPYLSIPTGFDEAQFCVRDFEKTYARVRDLLALRDVYDSDAWRATRRLARNLGLVRPALCVDPLEAIFKYPSQSSSGDEVRPLQQDAGRDVPEENYRVLRQGQQG